MKTLQAKLRIYDDNKGFQSALYDRSISVNISSDNVIMITATTVVDIEDGLRERRYDRIALSPIAIIMLKEVLDRVAQESGFCNNFIDQMEREGYEFPKPVDNKGLEKENDNYVKELEKPSPVTLKINARTLRNTLIQRDKLIETLRDTIIIKCKQVSALRCEVANMKPNDRFTHRGVNSYEKEHQLRSYRSKND